MEVVSVNGLLRADDDGGEGHPPVRLEMVVLNFHARWAPDPVRRGLIDDDAAKYQGGQDDNNPRGMNFSLDS